jgi:hypothetical protein
MELANREFVKRILDCDQNVHRDEESRILSRSERQLPSPTEFVRTRARDVWSPRSRPTLVEISCWPLKRFLPEQTRTSTGSVDAAEVLCRLPT